MLLILIAYIGSSWYIIIYNIITFIIIIIVLGQWAAKTIFFNTTYIMGYLPYIIYFIHVLTCT